MPNSQRGVTFLGWMFLLAPLAVIVYAGIRVTPIYLNYFHVAHAMTQLSSEFSGENPVTPQGVRTSLEKRFDIEYVTHVSAKDVDVRREGEHWVAEIDYEDVAPLFSNMSILLQFHKQVDLK
jgi:DNA-dependent RNA polymerase auxiliary subunit epsilon